jgi:cobalamin biosynthesis Mg chelatase CobN
MSWTSNGQAVFNVDSGLGAGLLTAAADMVSVFTNREDNDKPSPDPTPNNGTGTNSTGGGGGNGPGSGTNGVNGGTGGDSNSGATSGTSSSVGQATAASASAGSAGSNGQSGTDSKKTVQELLIDNTVKNPTVWSIIGIIILLIVILGAYYRNELMKMIKKSKK